MFTALLGSTRLGSTLNKPLAQAELGSKGARIFWPEAQLQNLVWAKLDPSSKQAWTKLEISSSNTLNSCYFGPFPVRFKLEQCLKHIWMKLETCLNKAWTKLEPGFEKKGYHCSVDNSNTYFFFFELTTFLLFRISVMGGQQVILLLITL